MSQPAKYTLIAGAGSGIGLAIAKRLAARGQTLALVGRDERKLRAAHDMLPGQHHFVYACDCANPAEAQALADMLKDRFSRLDCLVNSIGIFESHDATASELADWRRCLDVMLDAAVHLTRLAVPLMTNGGSMVHVTSIHSRVAERGSSSYAMAKAAIEQFVRSLALEKAHLNIRVNALAPGFVDTPMSAASGSNELESDWFKQNYIDGHHLPMKRPAHPDEIAGPIEFLLSDDASYITGQTLIVDGGLTITF